MDVKLAKKLNTQIIKHGKTPHERDLARMRLNIIKEAIKRGRTTKSIRG